MGLQANRASIAFQQPVNPSEVPNYYNVVKEPMGKKKNMSPISVSSICTFFFRFVHSGEESEQRRLQKTVRIYRRRHENL